MPRAGQTTVEFNGAFFDRIMKSAAVENITKKKADEALAIAQRAAPVDSGDYKRGLAVVRHDSRYRFSWRVIGRDAKTLLVEARTGNLARALKAVKGP